MTTANIPKSKFGLPAKIATLDPAENVENVENVENAENVENFESRRPTYPKGIKISKELSENEYPACRVFWRGFS